MAIRQLLRTRPNPLTPAEVLRLCTARPAGPTPQPSADPCHHPTPRLRHRRGHGRREKKIALGRVHAGKTISIHVDEHELTVHGDDGLHTIRRTTDYPVTRIEAHRPRPARRGAPG